MNERRLIVGVTGGIAAYKTAYLVSRLVQQGCQVQVVMTAAATQFVGPTTFAALTGRPVATDAFRPKTYPLGAHIELARWGQLLCVAPASADFLARAASGRADDLLSTLYLCFDGPVLMAPAMNDVMWERPAVQRNVRQLHADGVHLVGPEAGWLSCRREAVGRMAEPDQILEQLTRQWPPDETQA
jgi:phosphopantothenoylcysteine decarboxylase/phosphopantothenate--cysteine ligase